MTISDKYDKLRERNHKVFNYQHYPKWCKDNGGKDILVQDEYEHEELAPKDYSLDPYLASRRADQEESRENVLELAAKPPAKPVKQPNLNLSKDQKLDAKPVAKKEGSTLLNHDSHS
jgi:hypothetical protein